MDTESSSDEEYSRSLSRSYKKRLHQDRKRFISESPSPRRVSRKSYSRSPQGRQKVSRRSRYKNDLRDRSRSAQRDERSYFRRRLEFKEERDRFLRKYRGEDKGRKEDIVKTVASTKPDEKDRLGGRAREKLSVLAKLGIELKLPEQDKKRKLWTTEKPSGCGTAWQAASFADGKLTAKFQRLMGIKSKEDKLSGNEAPVQDQEQLFKRMEAEYEVARQTTHTLRGAGLGFSK